MDVKAILYPFAWKQEGMKHCFKVEDGFEFKFHVVNKKTGELVETKYCMKPSVCLHTINAYEEEVNGKRFIVIDICTADECFDLFDSVNFTNMTSAVPTEGVGT